MIVTWLIYLLIILMIIADILLVTGIVALTIFLATILSVGLLYGFVEKKLDTMIHGEFDRIKAHAVSRSYGSAAEDAVDVAKTTYSILYRMYSLYQLALSLPPALAAVTLITLGSGMLLAINSVLVWIMYTCFL